MSLMRMTLVLAGICWVNRGFWSSNDVNSCWLEESALFALTALKSKRWNHPSAPTATTKFWQNRMKQTNIMSWPCILPKRFISACAIFNKPFLYCKHLQQRHKSARKSKHKSWVRERLPFDYFGFLHSPCPHRFWWSRVWARHSCTPAIFHWCPPRPAHLAAAESNSTCVNVFFWLWRFKW